MMPRTLRSALLLAALSFVLASCGRRFDYVDVTLGSSPPLPVTVNSSRVAMPVGIAAQVYFQAVRRNDSVDGDGIDVRSTDSRIIGAIDTGGSAWILHGENIGRAELEVWYDNELVERIPVEITEQ